LSRTPQLYSIGQARKLLLTRHKVSVSYRTLRRYIEQGRIHAHHFSERPQQAGQWLLDEATIDALAPSLRRVK